MTSTYSPTRQKYYQNNKEKIKAKRRIAYQENIAHERDTALSRHYKNKKQNNKNSLEYYYEHSKELNKKRQERRIKSK